MRRYSSFKFYTVAGLLCAAGILTAIVGDTWAGRSPFIPAVEPSVNTGSTVPPREVDKSLDESLAQSGGSFGVVCANTSIFWVTVYTKCGHEKVREELPDAQMVGKTHSQFAACYPAYEMTAEGGVIRMVRTIDQYCPDHYYIQSDDNGGIYVYRNMDGLDKLSMVTKLAFSIDYVPEDYWPLLAEGMVFGSIEEIEGLIEDAET